MALAPTLYDFELAFSDPDRGLALPLKFKTARHPSETFERVWLRVLAYCWRYEERLQFGPGLSDTDAPDLLATDLTGQVTQWIRVGKSEPAKVQRAIDQNPGAQVSVLFESQLRQEQFLAEARAGSFPRLVKAQLAGIDANLVAALAAEDLRRIKCTVTLVSDTFYVDLGGETHAGELSPVRV